ncbi:hypothetical protein ABVT39_010099 [Epinephelus coioides]
MGLDQARLILQHDQTGLNLEPTREKKARKTKTQLEKVCRGRTQGNKNILEGSREDRPTLNQLEEVRE